jgi:hypothetical protein
MTMDRFFTVEFMAVRLPVAPIAPQVSPTGRLIFVL